MKARVLSCMLAACSLAPKEDARPWVVVFQDEFDGTALDTKAWTIETGSKFGTQQKDYDRAENIAVRDGHLVITARKEAFGGEEYTSGRMKTAGKVSRTYGRFEARMRLPHGQGMWPAFWLLAEDFPQKGWPDCGEIDVLSVGGHAGRRGEPATGARERAGPLRRGVLRRRARDRPHRRRLRHAPRRPARCLRRRRGRLGLCGAPRPPRDGSNECPSQPS